MTGGANTGVVSRAQRTVLAVSVLLLISLPLAWARGQRPNAPHSSPAPRYSAPRSQSNRNQPVRPEGKPQNYGRPGQQSLPYRGAGAQNGEPRQIPLNSPAMARPGFPGSTYQGQGYGRPNNPPIGPATMQQPRYGAPPGYAQPPYAPPGHLGAWLNAHRGIPAQDQERMLHSDPSFTRLPQADQQRLVRQLNRVDQMPEAQRQRRLARAENLERLSPQERAQVQDSARRWNSLPTDRQAVMKGAFRDLRSVPPDQRETVLNSARYQNAFSPEERGILSNMLRVEPYEAPR